jgi:hypothetical protein
LTPSLRYSRTGGEGTWLFDGLRMETIIETKPYPTAAAVAVTIKLAPFDFTKISGYSVCQLSSLLSLVSLFCSILFRLSDFLGHFPAQREGEVPP